MNCPRCNTDTLFDHKYEGFAVKQCSSCYGHWLSSEDLSNIIHKRLNEFESHHIKNAIINSFRGIPKSELETVINCPECSAPMNAVNYADDSGIIIDRCPQGHGLWFDQNELDKAQEFREYWQKNISQNEEYFQKLLKEKYDPSNKYDQIPISLYLLSCVFHEYVDKLFDKIKS